MMPGGSGPTRFIVLVLLALFGWRGMRIIWPCILIVAGILALRWAFFACAVC